MSPVPVPQRRRRDPGVFADVVTAISGPTSGHQPPSRRSRRTWRARLIYDPSHQPARRPTRIAAPEREMADTSPANPRLQQSTAVSQQPPQTAAIAPTPAATADDCSLCRRLDDHLPDLVCKQCKVARVHIDCLADTSEFHSESEEADWHCPQCRSCNVCYEPNYTDPIYTCFACKSHLHRACNTSFDGCRAPLGHIYRSRRIRCAECRQRGVGEQLELRYWQQQQQIEAKRRQRLDAEAAAAITENCDSSKHLDAAQTLATLCQPVHGLPTPQWSQPKIAAVVSEFETVRSAWSSGDEVEERLLRKLDPFCRLVDGKLRNSPALVPDCRSWSKERLYEYLCRYLDESIVRPLLNEQVDGRALLLLTRRQVLAMPGDGRLLELWMHVLRLQKRRNQYDLF